MVIFFSILASSAYSLNLRGNHLSPIIFEPGKEIVNHYTIEGTDREVEINLGGELLQYVRVTEVTSNEFDLIIEMPETLPEPGSYSFSLHVNELSDSGGSAIGSSVSVNLIFLVEVPPYGKAIGISFDIPNVNEHQPVPISINVESKGLEDIAMLRGQVTVYDLENNSVAFVSLTEKLLPALASTSLSANLPPDKLSAGRYWAEAVVNYDGEIKIMRDDFKVGNLDLILVEYTSQLSQTFSEFRAKVENNWGNPIQIAYATVSINGTELLTTPSLSLGPWQEAELKGILRTDFLPGNYSGAIQLFYDDLSKVENVTFSVLESPKEVKETPLASVLIIAGILLLFIVGIIIGYLLLKKRNKKE